MVPRYRTSQLVSLTYRTEYVVSGYKLPGMKTRDVSLDEGDSDRDGHVK